MSDSHNKRPSSSLVALGAAAVLAVYTAGYARTRSAAERFAAQDAERRLAPVPTTPTAARAPEPVPTAAPAPPRPSAKHPDTKQPRKTSTVDSASPPSIPTAKPPVADTALVSPAPAPAPVPATPPRDTTAAPPPAATDTARAPEKEVLKDGLYFGWGKSRHGDIQAGIEIKGGRITSAFISECLTQYSCSWVSALPAQVVARQSANVDYVTGATQSANAFYYAVVDALKKAK